MMRVELKVPYSIDNVTKLSEFLEPKFELLNWQWAVLGIPRKKDLEKTFSELIKTLGETSISSATGGLIVNRDKKGKLWIGVDSYKLKKVINKEELESIFKKKSKRMFRFI